MAEDTRKFDVSAWKDLWVWMRPYRGKYLWGLGALAAVDIINIILPLVIKDAIDALPLRDFSVVVWACVFYGALVVLQSGGRYFWRIWLIGASHLVAKDARAKLYRHLQSVPMPFYQKHNTGELMSRATNDIESLRMAVGPGVLVCVDAVFMFALLIPAMFWLSFKLTLLTVCFYPLVPIITYWIGERIDRLFESLQAKMAGLSAFTQESLTGIRLLKSLVLEKHTHRQFEAKSKAYRDSGVVLARYESVFAPSLQVVSQLGVFMLIIFGGLDVMSGVISLGTFIAFHRFVAQLSWPMEAIGWAVSMTREGRAANRRLQSIFDIPIAVSQRELPQAVTGPQDTLRIQPMTHRFDLGGDQFSLEINRVLRIPAGGKVGLVGPVGSGKSTLISLILRLYEPNLGSLFFRGVDVAAIKFEALRTSIASVEQQIFLFSEDVLANVRKGRRDFVSEEFAKSMVRLSELEKEILEWDAGYQTRLGERGLNLSGGQKQRLALARALVRKPDLMLLDDSFSAVDIDIEAKIIQNLLREFPKMALLVASHRMSIMPLLDEIWVLDKGRISAVGTHDQLLAESELYRHLWQEKSSPREERINATKA